MKCFKSFDEMLEYRVSVAPDAPAFLREKAGEVERVSFLKFRADVLDRAKALTLTGKTSLGVLSDGSYEAIVEALAGIRAGLQITMLGANATPDQITDSDIDLLWGDDDLKEELAPALTAGVKNGKGRILFFTSGTTSRRKAVVLTEQSLCASAYNGGSLLPLEPDDILMCMLPLDHVFGFVCAFLWATSCGAAVALGRGPRHYFDDCAFFQPTALSAVPMLLGFLLQRRLLNPEMRLVLIGAGDCPPELPLALKALGKRVSFGYGLTETSSGVALSLGDDPYAMTVCPEDRITLGDDGEILISAPTCVMQGYYKDPAATDAVLVNGVLHTGDLGAFDEQGLLHITGRKKEILVFSDGTKIFLPEYERDLSGALAGRDFAVVDLSGSPVLVLNGDESERVDLTIRLASVMKDLPIGRRIKDICFISEPLPRTATGKIKRWELQQKVRTV
ncbi:MAG: AMP-binding protein [Clostridia bacterium]|nr:AMP-binding protein [Clostridia bacterium]